MKNNKLKVIIFVVVAVLVSSVATGFLVSSYTKKNSNVRSSRLKYSSFANNAILLYSNDSYNSISASRNDLTLVGHSVGAYIFDNYKVEQNTPYMFSVDITDINAENVGFVVGTLGDDNSHHVMFDWRRKNGVDDIYVWRSACEEWNWLGIEDESLDLSVSFSRSSATLFLIYVDGRYCFFINGVQVLSLSENEVFSWSTITIKDTVGEDDVIKLGITTSYGTASFKNFSFTTNIAEIRHYVPAVN